MFTQPVLARLKETLRSFRKDSRGNFAMTFALSVVPIVGAVGAAVDYGQSGSIRSAMQGAADAASLSTIKIASTLNPAQVQSAAVGFFNASFSRPGIAPAVTATYDAVNNVVTVSAAANFKPNFVGMLGVSNIAMTATSKASVGTKQWQVCVLVTEPTDNHTLLVQDGSKIDFTNCMVQVNTANWDAVEARGTSYIHSTNGENCFVGDIHYGDVVPPKNPTCTMFPDPHDTLRAPDNACTYTNFNTAMGGNTLSPGTYCGGILVNKDVTFNPGLYVIKDGKFQIVGNSNVIANGVTFVLVGSNAYLSFNTSGTITMSPAGAAAGVFSGFQFYYDDPEFDANGKKKGNKKGAKSTISSAKMTSSGIFYLQGQEFIPDQGAVITINPGSIIAHTIRPDGGSTLNLTGDINSSNAALASMKKIGSSSGGPVLIK
jgi:Flp pilus assembly protein TadG